MKAISEWIQKGSLKRKFHIVHGLDATPGALPLLYSGGNTGKLCVAFFALAEPISYLASPGSSRFPSTRPQPSFNLCNCLYACNLSPDVYCTRLSFIMIFACLLALTWRPPRVVRKHF